MQSAEVVPPAGVCALTQQYEGSLLMARELAKHEQLFGCTMGAGGDGVGGASGAGGVAGESGGGIGVAPAQQDNHKYVAKMTTLLKPVRQA